MKNKTQQIIAFIMVIFYIIPITIGFISENIRTGFVAGWQFSRKFSNWMTGK